MSVPFPKPTAIGVDSLENRQCEKHTRTLELQSEYGTPQCCRRKLLKGLDPFVPHQTRAAQSAVEIYVSAVGRSVIYSRGETKKTTTTSNTPL